MGGKGTFNGGRDGEELSGTRIKDTWTKPKGDRKKGGKWAWLGWRGVVRGKWRQLSLSNNLKNVKKIRFLRDLL